MNRWVSSPYIEIQNMARSMIAKFEKYWSDIPGVLAVASGFGSKELITEYESEALLMGVEQVEETSSFDYYIEVVGVDEEFELYKRQAVSSLNKSELERYLGEQVENNTPNFDILSWWKVNKGKYHILAKVAKDILAVPISTVASESAFRSGGEVLSPHHRRLHLDTLEALICAQNWIWAPLREFGSKFGSTIRSNPGHKHTTFLRWFVIYMSFKEEKKLLMKSSSSKGKVLTWMLRYPDSSSSCKT
ncbi:hypothetical protein Dsin_028826 [Dipteronia sinensis]|uniref:HAT C-terminal dimerisation domain-containing protein n=1 Tax=Dipteronia sinensis TaxID=43782 RepID=A0AAE0DUS4_9ROSI|nr:hypothetical protein Dsin_028826 [Dipteronia sinensis]